MNLSVPKECEQFVEDVVASGKFRSEADVVTAALRLLSASEQRWQSLRDDIQSGIADIERGAVAPLDVADIKSRGRKRLAKRIARR